MGYSYTTCKMKYKCKMKYRVKWDNKSTKYSLSFKITMHLATGIVSDLRIQYLPLLKLTLVLWFF